ncbi:glycosyltransferase family 2 protein [Polynucleobacter sp. HIN7]|uniref:glycosyltransferase family 2 protein n=1 Tax=Polynucleobacter sp. HIN7 TaxID=3047866 RepID=UPI0025741740|nr:glycosyltransferase family 2 protein [Polynucleobacter sp. HIN7]BEI36580.1 hypothetical protein PHIN7_03040 [Polynucleobacter sp. HIN7]
MPNKSLPLITIITSTLNAGESLRHTARSIQKQSYPHIQWIIADGKSSDNTLKIIEELGDLVNVWFSKPDRGIYDAWNKALKFARGEWVQFIGSGDELADIDTLEKIASILGNAHPHYDLVYGRLQYLSEHNRKFLEEVGAPWSKIKNEWEFFRPKLPIHPEVFHHISLFKEDEPFDVSYKFAGDSHFLMQCIRSKDPLYVPILVNKMPLGGATGSIYRAHLISLETRRACRELGYQIPLSHYLSESAKTFMKRICCFLFPDQYLFKIANGYRKLVGKQKRW